MKKKSTFANEIIKREHLHLKKGQMAIFNVNGNFGNYQVKIGPEYQKNARAIEINGHLHHLFASENHIKPNPSHKEIDRNLNGTVLLSEVTVHLFDKNGHGKKVAIRKPAIDGVHPMKKMNLAGQKGEQMMQILEKTGKLNDETYRIIQEDIFHSLKR